MLKPAGVYDPETVLKKMQPVLSAAFGV